MSGKIDPYTSQQNVLIKEGSLGLKALKPYWNIDYSAVVSKLFLYADVQSLSSSSTSLNKVFPENIGKSWCSIKSKPLQLKKLPKTLWQSSLYSHPISTVSEVIKSKKILLKPTKEQRIKFKQWFGVYRFVYNKIIDFKEEEYITNKVQSSYMRMRKDWKNKLILEFPWINDIPAHTVYGAMMNADKDYKLVIKKRVEGQMSKLPRCRLKNQKSCFILGNCISNKGIYPRLLGKLRTKEKLPDKPCDSRLLYEYGKWYILIPIKSQVSILPDNQGIVACDPGIRTFITAFSEDRIIKIGDGSFSRIVRLCHYLDDLISRSTKAPARKRKRMKQAATRMREKIRNLIDDMHWQAINYLFKNYETIVFPEGDFTDACKKAKRKIGRKSIRSLMGYAFARFRYRLIHKAKCLGRNVLIVNEAHTSKTANWTGEIVQNLGGRKFIKSQGIKMDRDVNGALGIFLKALVDHPKSIYRFSNC